MSTLGTSPDLSESLAPVRECVEEWTAEHEQLEQDLAESLAALDAYQKSLDAWQAGLAADRRGLAEERAAWEAERDAAGEQAHQELQQLREHAARHEQDTRQLEQQLEEARQRAHQLEASLRAKRAELDERQARWDDDFRHMRELLDQQLRGAEGASQAASAPAEAETATALDSVLEQFGQLRKQQADRRAGSPAT